MVTQLSIPLELHDPSEKDHLLAELKKVYRMPIDEERVRHISNVRLQYIIDWKKAFDTGGIEQLRKQQLFTGQRRDRESYSEEAAAIEKQVFRYTFRELFKNA